MRGSARAGRQSRRARGRRIHDPGGVRGVGHDQRRHPRLRANSELVLGTTADDSLRLLTETRDEAKTSFAAYTPTPLFSDHNDVEIYTDHEMWDWRIRTGCRRRPRFPPRKCASARSRGNGHRGGPLSRDGGRCRDGPTISTRTWRSLGLVTSRYDAFPPRQITDTMESPLETFQDRLNKLPGGGIVAVFLIPMIAMAMSVSATRSPSLLMFIFAGSMAAAVWLTGVSVFLYILPILFGIGAVGRHPVRVHAAIRGK